MDNFYDKTIKEVLSSLDVDPHNGLSERQVAERTETYGRNLLHFAKKPIWRRLIEPFLDLFMLILIVAFILAIIQGSTEEAFMISIDIIIDALIFYYQDFSTERILRSLRAETAHRVKVLRSGKITECDAVDLVPGDIVLLEEGEKIPADGRLIQSLGTLTNESLLTGESDSIPKDTSPIKGKKPLYEQKNMVFAGSFLVTGSGRFVVTATGNRTEYGRIATLATDATQSSPIQEKINKLVVRISAVIVILAIVIMVIQLFSGLSFSASAEFTLALVVSAAPEDLPIVTAIILALGARKMAQKKALVRELRAIESIGVVTTVCSDKTGTLTENHLSVAETWSLHPKNLGDLFIRTALPSLSSSDPMDTCLWDFATSARLQNIPAPAQSFVFDHDTCMSGNLFYEHPQKSAKNSSQKSETPILYLKGSPEAIINRCELTSIDHKKVLAQLESFASFGYKVIAIATVTPPSPLKNLSELPNSRKFHFLGLIAVSDTIRKEAKSAIIAARDAHVSVKMITGDHAGTALAIGKKLGLAKSPSDVLDCTRLSEIDDATLASRVKNSTIFARVSPSDKYRILEAIKHTEVVAMTGDGINDIPALRSAHVGIAMGDSPTIVQDSAEIILTDNNFRTITDAIYSGRIILTNIRRMLVYLLASNASEVLIGLIGLLFGHTQILIPIQILWVNLVTDNLLIIPIGLEPAERTALRQPPDTKDSPILSRPLIDRIIITATSTALVVCSTYFITNTIFSHSVANTLAFTSLVITQWSGAFAIRGLYESSLRRLKVKNRLFIFGVVAAIIAQCLANFGPLSTFVSSVSVPALPLLIVAIISFTVPFIFTEIHKILFLKKR